MPKIANPIIIIGAGRSGTNMLRDILVQIPGLATWPCDEINYIWRHGHAAHPTDVFPADFATPQIHNFVQKQFAWVQHHFGADFVVEKTCANTLRIPFINAIFPDCRFIHLVRDGRDVAVSAAERWQASLDLPYILKKARFVPKSDLPFYALRYAAMRVGKLVSSDKRIKSWGPRFEGIDEIYNTHPLKVACAIQWARCVEKATADLSLLPTELVHTLKYEDFTEAPADHLLSIMHFLGQDCTITDCRKMTSAVRNGSRARWKKALTKPEIAAITHKIGFTLRAHGYSDGEENSPLMTRM